LTDCSLGGHFVNRPAEAGDINDFSQIIESQLRRVFFHHSCKMAALDASLKHAL
jgi:hypothetical protein